MKRFSPTVIGVFVLGAMLLAVAGILSFGAQAWWRERESFVVYFKESVHGLNTGSAVKLMGVPVGRVAAIHVLNPGDGGTVVQVVCEIDRGSAGSGANGAGVDLREPDVLRRLVENGLQARLNILGITGMLYLEMGFFGKPPEATFGLDLSENVMVPSTPSVFGGLTDQLAGIAVEIGEIDFAGLAASASRLMDTTSETIEAARLEAVFAEVEAAVAGLNELIHSRELQDTLVAAREGFHSLRRLAERIEGEVGPLSDELSGTAEALRGTLREVAATFDGLQGMIGPRTALGREMTDTLRTIHDAARSVERLADFLERNPEAIVRGRGDSR